VLNNIDMTPHRPGSAPPDIPSFDRAVGTLSRNGEVVGHLASRVLEMAFPSRQPWVWFVLVWLDGTRELKFEDFGPGWFTIRELEDGRFDHHGPTIVSAKRILRIKYQIGMAGPPMVFEYDKLPPAIAAQRWEELGLVDADF
jgi:hypothetical protein